MSNYSQGPQQRLVNELLLRLRSRGYGSDLERDRGGNQNLAKEEAENRVLNLRALPEYELLKGRIVDCVTEINKFLDFDDQFRVSVYLHCTSVRFRNRVLVLEFKQVPFNERQINHSLDLIFQATPADAGSSGRITLVLTRKHGEFVWRQLQPMAHGLSMSSKDLAVSAFHWLEDGSWVFGKTTEFSA
jgi:hypothetical protein